MTLFLFSCSHQKSVPTKIRSKKPSVQRRSISSKEVQPIASTSIELRYPDSIISAQDHWYEVWVKVQDKDGNVLDVDEQQMKVKTSSPCVKVSHLNFVETGLYSFVFLPTEGAKNIKFDVLYGKKKLGSKSFTVAHEYDLDRSKLIFLQNDSSTEKRFLLKLKDENSKEVFAEHPPEIYFDGEGVIKKVEQNSKKEWEVVVELPEGNTVGYLGLKRQSRYARKKLRVQHVYVKIDVASSGFKDKEQKVTISEPGRAYIKFVDEFGRRLVDYAPWRIWAQGPKDIKYSVLKSDTTGSFFDVSCTKVGSFALDVYLGEERLDSINITCTHP